MTFERTGRIADVRERRLGWTRRAHRPAAHPVRIGSFDAGDPAPEVASVDRVLLLRFEWRTSRDEVQPVLLALPELLD